MNGFGKRIILASGSPRRQDLLKQIGLSFEVVVKPVDETVPSSMPPNEAVSELALRKAREVAEDYTDCIIIAADTVVFKDNRILGKPLNQIDAFNTLKYLNGSGHHVVTGFCILDQAENRVFLDSADTKVFFRNLSDAEIQAYVDSGEPMDKAGSYGIQGLGAVLVDHIEGCYFNVVGLPLTKMTETLKKVGVFVL